MKNTYTILFGAICALGLVTMGCDATEQNAETQTQSDESQNEPEAAPVTKTGTLEQNWQSENASIKFADGTYSGNAGCNDFSGTYEMTGENTVHINPMAMTRKMCVDPNVMQNEANFSVNFPGDYKIMFQGTTIGLVNDERSWIFGSAEGE